MKRTLVAAGLALAASSAHAYLLNFPVLPESCSSDVNGLGTLIQCSNTQHISHHYGDVPGIVDVTYDDLNSGNSLVWWDTGYDDLYGVLYGNGVNGHPRIELQPLNGATIELLGFDLGSWHATNDTSLNIYELGSATPLYSFSGSVGLSGNLHTSFDFAAGELSSASGLAIEWTASGYYVGIDNIEFTIANANAIPEPGSYALMLAGLGVLGFVARVGPKAFRV